MFTFRTSITFAVMTFIVALAALLIVIQARALSLATRDAASAYMDATSSKAIGRLQTEIASIASLVDVLATSSSVTDTDEVAEVSAAIPVFKTALLDLPQMDSIYVGFENGAWLEARLLSELNDEQRDRLRATIPGADVAINLVRSAGSGELPMRRIFEDRQGDKVGQLDLWKYGYDPLTRFWYRDTRAADRLLVSSPYLAFTIGAPVVTISVPLRGKARGVVAADLKLDNFSNFVPSAEARRARNRSDLRLGWLAHCPSRFHAIRYESDDASFPTAIAQRQRDQLQLRRRCESPAGVAWPRPLRRRHPRRPGARLLVPVGEIPSGRAV
jgi:adenylate cyclase